jgi:sortase A
MARTSRWDRPPVPKDVRWSVRLFGKVLICTGLLMFGFVAYQLWGTGIEYARAQNRLDGRFEELMEANGVDPDVNPIEAALSTTAAPTTVPATTTPPTTRAPETAAPGTAAADPTTSTAAPTTTLAPTTTIAPTTSTSTPPQVLDWSYVDEEQFIGQLWIPSIGIEGQNVVQGVGPTDLQDGPGHYPDTPFPGELGNAAIAGHRTTWGQPFHDLPDVEIGDEIGFLLPDGRVFIYVMTGSETVDPGDSHVVATTDPTRATLTLTTCTPVGTAEQRYILYAELVPERSAPVGAFVDRSGGGVTVLPGQEDGSASAATTTLPVLATEPASSAPETTESAPDTTAAAFVDDPVVSTGPPPTQPATTEVPATIEAPGTSAPGTAVAGADQGTGGEASSDSEDAFSSHWFDDRAALPQVALWAAISTAVVVGAYLLARHFRNSWIGLAVGVVPFIVTLYFFYQNVNRLLPAAL